MTQATHYDAIVVGSGISGGWAAKELTEHGLKTLVLEAGGPVDPATDYVEHVQPWEMHFRGMGDRKALERDQPMQRGCYACDEIGHKFFVKDTENPLHESRRRPVQVVSAADRSADARSRGDARSIAGAISTSTRTRRTATATTGRFATRISRPGTATSSGSSASAAPPKDSHSCPTASSCRRCR